MARYGQRLAKQLQSPKLRVVVRDCDDTVGVQDEVAVVATHTDVGDSHFSDLRSPDFDAVAGIEIDDMNCFGCGLCD